MLFDQSQDLSGEVQYKLAQAFNAPDYVKQAAFEELEGDPVVLPAQAYAGPNKSFPMHTKAATWLSTAFLARGADKLSGAQLLEIKGRLQKAAAAWGIADDINQLYTEVTKAATTTPEPVFALNLHYAHGVERFYPINTAEQVKQASAFVLQNRDKLSFDNRHQMAKNVLKQAEKLDCPLDNVIELQKMAGCGAAATSRIAEAWRSRAKMIKGTSEVLSKQASVIADEVVKTNLSILDQHTLINVAKTLADFDVHTKLANYYDEGLDRPEDVVFAISHKQASQILNEYVSTVSGKLYSIDALTKISGQHAKDWLGFDLHEALSDTLDGKLDPVKVASIVPTLPRPDAALFEKCLESAGVTSELEQIKHAYSVFGSPAEIAKAASEYRS